MKYDFLYENNYSVFFSIGSSKISCVPSLNNTTEIILNKLYQNKNISKELKWPVK